MRLTLASASPRRLELLQRIGISPQVLAADVDESVLPGESPSDYVMRVAFDKAHRVRALIARAGSDPAVDSIVLAADTAVVNNAKTLGKPVDRADAVAMLNSLSGRTHEVLTAVVVIDPDDVEQSVLARATVTFATIDRREVDWYVSTGEPLDKAGSYALQGMGGVLVERIDGDPTTVIGLPLRDTVDLLRSAGLIWPNPTDVAIDDAG
ncbi:MAG: nucleoside triphosphate pyrophosphatase [Microthrixaceae bacterium]